ncbi:MAG: hypothetical protein IAE91_03925 [Ignavibacteriaceae bacterium]|nr:hypothetical protein [Ignavibacteriaceae bacterium]
MENNLLIYSDENLLKQLESAEYNNGYFKLKFYTKDGLLSPEESSEISDFFYYPSGGTLRDKSLNIVFYSSKFDTYKGFDPFSISKKN